jgi:hypothetical protein
MSDNYFNDEELEQETIQQQEYEKLTDEEKEMCLEDLLEDYDIHELIERFKEEKEEFELDYYMQGKRDGILWAKMAHYIEIKSTLRWSLWDNYKEIGNSIQPRENGDVISENVLMYFKRYHKRPLISEMVSMFCSGWKEGVKEFWSKIESEIEEEN